jgi:hypothetical protein
MKFSRVKDEADVMNVEDPRWDEYEARFRELAERVELQKGPQPELASAQLHLCLYGDNAMTPEQEFDVLDQFEQRASQLKGTEILTAYWEDVVLYLP